MDSNVWIPFFCVASASQHSLGRLPREVVYHTEEPQFKEAVAGLFLSAEAHLGWNLEYGRYVLSQQTLNVELICATDE